MAADGEVVFDIVADIHKATQSIQEISELLKKAVTDWENTANRGSAEMTRSFDKAFDIQRVKNFAINAAKHIKDFINESVSIKSALVEIQNVIDVTFGDGASQIEAWASKAGNQFGLTELQAKQYTSTLGAMMKSAGMAGDEIVTVSTDLAGLAADMASFYNIDFDTAFMKIRSGIAGISRPLRDLGINMNVAQLEAYALSQGITKAYNDMTQSEQIMLRYQYLMNATADAQGDFARTADSLENANRRVQTAITEMESAVGGLIYNIKGTWTNTLADFISMLVPEQKPKTVLDEIADIKIDEETKIAQINNVAAQAQSLLETLEQINTNSGLTPDSDVISYINSLTSEISALDSSLAGADDMKANLTAVAEGLSAELGGDADKWTNLLKAISGNAKGAIDATKGDSGKTKAFLENVAAGADDLTADYSPYWETLLSVLGDNAGKAISALADGGSAGAILSNIADGANNLGLLTGGKWQSFVNALGGLAGKSDVPTNLNGIANALSKKLGGSADEWDKLLTTIGTKLGTASTAATDDDGATAGFMSAAAAAADDLGEDYSGLWTSLLAALGEKAPTAVSALKDATNVGTNLGSIATGANKLKSGQDVIWEALYTALKDINELSNIFSSDAAGNVGSLAAALSAEAPSEEKAAAWQTFLDALGSNAGALSALTGEDAQGAAAWLTAMSEALDKAKLDPTNVQAWNDLLGIFTGGLSEENKQAYNDAIIDSLLAMGNQSEYAREALAALGYESDDITKAQDRWLAICRSLVKAIPELSSIINTQTGEVKGGTQAIDDYIKAWQSDKILEAQLDALKKKREIYEQEVQVDHAIEAADKKAKAAAYIWSERNGKARGLIYENGKYRAPQSVEEVIDYLNKEEERIRKSGETERSKSLIDKAHYDELDEFVDYLYEWNADELALPAALEVIDNDIARIAEMVGKSKEEINNMTEATKEAEKSMSLLAQAATGDENALKKYEDALKNAGDALQAVADYQEKVRSETESTVKSLISGFGKLETPMQKVRREVVDLKKAIDEAKTDEERASLEATKKSLEDSQISITSMRQGLESQLTYMREYQKMLSEARAKGVSEDILATLSDGSQESFDYLYALTYYGGDIDKLNEAYDDVQAEAEKFTSTLTNQKLTADETYKTLVEKAQEAVDGLNLSDAAYTNTADTVLAIARAVGDNSEEVKNQVDNVLAQIARLNAASLTINGFGAGIFGTRLIFRGQSNANGIDSVPYDGYLALLHQGERVQTAAEADLARRYSYQQPTFDYNAMGGAIGANIGRGNVYLDGKVVGNLISARQGDSYRALERSGWQG